MKLIVFSDIHGNIYSLEKAVKLMEEYKPDQYLFLGDMAGYYYYQNKCIELLKTLSNLISIKGNHDDLFLKSISDGKLLKKLDNRYGKSYSMLKNNITDLSLEYLNNMQDYEKNNIYEAYHGSPNNYYLEYIYPDNKDLALGDSHAPYMFLGHTHYLMNKYINGVRVINPGSIGQPRDLNKPSFSVIDTTDGKVEFVRYTYNKKELVNNILLNNDKSYLTTILQRK
ncbi:metallophosphoesterase family protein [Sulfurimonas sp. SAG-AH-194-I05]|nr:metallophosphoesterase family protein [Sulfurimonas sp. SAG-AH-194-I05]MDF1876193.1 metallophosphoesterase family protein [Sulfurimonas sp. SAG-AH-194-I05]